MSLPPPPPPAGPPPGWYPDPSGQPGLRWWDGSRWTEHFSAPPPPTYYAVAAGPQVTTRLGAVILAGWWRRFGAYVLDALIVGIPGFVIGLIIGSYSFATSTGLARQQSLSVGAQVALLVTTVALALGYPFFFLRARGQTLGMMAARIRAVDRVGGGPLTTVQTWQRVLTFFFLVSFWEEIAVVIDFNTVGTRPAGVVILDLLAFAALFTTALWPLGNPFNQTLQDKAASTIVVLTN